MEFSYLLVGTFREAYLPIPTKEMVRRPGDPLGPHCLKRLCHGNRKYSMADTHTYVGFDVMSKAAPGTPGLTDCVFYGSGPGECWNSH